MNCDHCICFWVVYFNPSDFPGRYVVRRQWTLLGLPEEKAVVADRAAYVASDLADARSKIPPWLHCIGRQVGDEPQIHEVWL